MHRKMGTTKDVNGSCHGKCTGNCAGKGGGHEMHRKLCTKISDAQKYGQSRGSRLPILSATEKEEKTPLHGNF
jgi:hypothetical protein